VIVITIKYHFFHFFFNFLLFIFFLDIFLVIVDAFRVDENPIVNSLSIGIEVVGYNIKTQFFQRHKHFILAVKLKDMANIRASLIIAIFYKSIVTEYKVLIRRVIDFPYLEI
jgi:hypothetical protein